MNDATQTADPVAIRCSIYRGGTSRGVMFREIDLPFSEDVRTGILLSIFGGPDPRQLDGVGGATMQTSKAMVVGPAGVPAADVQMNFAQILVGRPTVDWHSVCGNMTSAVGPFAIDRGIVPAVEPVTAVRIYSVNSNKYVTAHVPVANGRSIARGDYAIPGVPGTGARIDLEWLDPGGAITGRLLPTGRARDAVRLGDGRTFTVSIVDAGNLTVFCDARELGLTGIETPSEFDARKDWQQTVEEIRVLGGEMSGIAKGPGLPKIGFFAPPASYGDVQAKDVDLVGRLMSAQLMHKSYMGAGAICTAAAAVIDGTIVHEICGGAIEDTIRIGHPAGVMDAGVRWRREGTQTTIASGTYARTARRIMDGSVFVPRDRLDAAGSAEP